MKKKNWKKILKKKKKILDLFSILKGPESGKEKTGTPESGHFKICRTSGPDVMSGWALLISIKLYMNFWAIRIAVPFFFQSDFAYRLWLVQK